MFDDIPECVDELLEDSIQDSCSNLGSVTKRTDNRVHHLSIKWGMWYRYISPSKLTILAETSPDKTETHGMSFLSYLNTVEDFWSIYRDMRKPYELHCGDCLQVFPDGEDPFSYNDIHINGGKCSFIITNDLLINEIWERLLLATVGGQLESLCKSTESVTQRFLSGVVLGKRKSGARLGVWVISEGADLKKLRLLARSVRRLCRISRKVPIEYQLHASKGEVPIFL